MREPTYLVLASLPGKPLHGHAIIQRTEQLSGGRVRLATGTLSADSADQYAQAGHEC